MQYIVDIAFESITDDSTKWTENRDCFNELRTIKNALSRHDEWAIKSNCKVFCLISFCDSIEFFRISFYYFMPIVLDAWGNFPSGMMSGNFFDLGSFSQCFHITRNDIVYKTQYCIGQLKVRSQIKAITENTVQPQLVFQKTKQNA